MENSELFVGSFIALLRPQQMAAANEETMKQNPFSYKSLLGTLALSLIVIAPASALASSQVATISNQTSGNMLELFDVQSNGMLTSAGTLATGGIGTGGGLGSQGGVAYDSDSGILAAVNAGDNTVSIFVKHGHNLQMTSRVSSHGFRPVSVTVRHNVLFVLNQGDANHASSIQGFNVYNGGAYALPGSWSGLSDTYTNPAQVSFSPNGRNLVVTEKGTNKIGVFEVSERGQIWGRRYFDSEGATPFGFAFDKRGDLFVTEAFGGAANASAVSSYQKLPNGMLQTVSASVPTTQTAACWAVASPDNKFVFAANAGSGTISTYSIGVHGIIELAGNSTPIPGSTPVDMAISDNGKFVYLLGAGIPGVVTFSVANDGTLTKIDTDSVVKGSAGLTFIK